MSELCIDSELKRVLGIVEPTTGEILRNAMRPVPLADALAKRDERRAWISGLVEAHCHRLGLNHAQTASCVDCALAVWDGGRGSSPATAVAEGKLVANRIAYEVDPQPPLAA